MVGLFAQRSFQEFPVQRLHVLVPVGEPHLGTLVDAPQDIAAIGRQLLPVVYGLPAAAGAPAGTSHHLNEVVIHIALVDGVHQLTGVAQSADHCHADVARAGDGEYGLLPAVHTAYGGEGVRLRFLAGNEIVRAPQSRVHHAAGGAEDHRRAGAGAQRTVKGCFWQHRGIDLFAPQHPHDLAGGQHHIHVLVALLVLHGGQRTLRLLGGAGHDGHHKQLLGVHADLLGKVALGDGTEHLLGALGGGQVFRI